MIEDTVKKYGKILKQENNIFLIKTDMKAEELKKKLEDNLKIYSVEILEKQEDRVKIKLVKDMVKVFQKEIKKYNDGVPPEDLRYMED